MIPHSRLHITPEDEEAVARVIRSGMLAQGAMVAEFEKAVAAYLGVRGGVAVNSGTAALHLALLALKVGAGDEVILPSYVCVAPLNAIHYTGARPVLAEADPATGNIDPESVRAKVTSKTKAVIVPHLFGQPARITELQNLGVPVIEDLAQSIGARCHGRMAGGFGVMAICSFYATKVFTTGEGGMVLTDRDDLLDVARDMRDYDEKARYQTRYNYKMTEFQAALGLSQLQRLEAAIRERKRLAAFYNQALADLPCRRPTGIPGCDPIYYRYILRLDQDPDNFLTAMEKRQVACRRPIYKPIHQLLQCGDFQITDRLWEESVSIPLYPGLTDQELNHIIIGIQTVLDDNHG